ncbi:hypothetical protein ACE193_16660 [Bernardetia sp. OM2101]|uniref:hypothetical protein n=1 Tax=Bernardetia sp. OM2101 TaxID=3344876 RepID=UPI0035D0C0F1
MKKNYLIYLFLVLSLCFSCGMNKDEKVNDAFLKDSSQYEQTKLLKQSNKKSVEIDTAMNNINSEDPAIPIFDDED